MHSALINLHTLAGAGSSRSCVCSVVGQRWPSHQSSKVLGDAHLPLLLQRLGFAVAVLHGSRPQNKAGRSSATSSDAAVAQGGTLSKPCKGGPLLQRFLSLVLQKYWDATPTAVGCMSLLQALDRAESSPLYFDHLAFRTFGVDGFGIKSMATIFLEFGYQQRDELQFPAKKLRALWFSPPKDQPDLPRIFISELKVNEMSPEAQEVIHRYCKEAGSGKYAPLCAVGGTLPWSTPSLPDFELLARESEYAAWTLVNGYGLNHTTVAVHRMRGISGGISTLVDRLKLEGFDLNEEGGTLKVSPDGLLVQAAIQADHVDFAFKDGEQGTVPGSYLELAQRLRLPEFEGLEETLLNEAHLRDGFEASNADKIFNSTVRQPQPVH